MGGEEMAHRIIIKTSAIVLMVSSSVAMAIEIPDMDQSEAVVACRPGCGQIVMYNVPDGSGSSFTEAGSFDGPVDATITLYLRSNTGNPIPFYPREDIWLADPWGDSYCLGGTIADHDTDINGETTWVNPLARGSWDDWFGFIVVVSGEPVTNGNLGIIYNSPDINGDLVVNLIDVSLFAEDYFGEGFWFRSDFEYDGVANLADIAKLSQAMGATCP
jgi:hypothetical protein